MELSKKSLGVYKEKYMSDSRKKHSKFKDFKT